MNNPEGMRLVMALDGASATLEQVGGKGASLARMVAAGLPVPPGFHVTTAAYRRFVEENGLQDKILAAVARVSVDQPATLDEASRQIEGLFAKGVMPADVAEEIRMAYADLGGGDLPVAVRSSATAEDLPGMSFAGQQESYLNMHGEAMVLDAVQRCWASLWTARAIGYRARHDIAPGEVSLAVVVQELVPADAAGILFTANPLSGSRDQVVINAAWGLGEAIVGGQVTPDTVVVEKSSGAILEEQIGEKDVMTVRTLDGTRDEPVPMERRTRRVLSPAQATELARIGVLIEELYGRPMDIEWALTFPSPGGIGAGGEVFAILQARPITALPEPSAPPVASTVEWVLPDPKGKYMRGSVLELLPDPLSPLFATLGLPSWNRSMTNLMEMAGLASIFGDSLLTTVNGYGYYHLAMSRIQVVKMILAIPRIILLYPQLLRSARQRWQEGRSRYAALVDRWQATDLSTAPAERLVDGVRDITDEAADYYLIVQSGILPGAYISESIFTLVYNRFLKGAGDPTPLTYVLGFDSMPIQAEQSLYNLAQWVGERQGLAASLESMSSEQFMADYREAESEASPHDGVRAEFWIRLADHLARFGHAIYDLDFAKPVLADDPAPVLEPLKFFLSGRASDPSSRRAVTESAREQATRRMVNSLRGLRLWAFRRLLRPAQRFAPLREDSLADVGLGWPVLRRMLREVGRRMVDRGAIDSPDDLFWLTLDELQGAATALDAGQPQADYHAVLAERRRVWESQRAVTPPVALPLKGGSRLMGIDFTSVMPARSDQPEGNLLKGVAASPGRVTGTARVIHGPGEFGQMRQGDILVARITTPAWTPLFALASGVVTDMGGPLSHSSIVAREYHIPAVLGTGVATERLSSGQRVAVDGDAGTVSMIS